MHVLKNQKCKAQILVNIAYVYSSKSKSKNKISILIQEIFTANHVPGTFLGTVAKYMKP